MNVDVKTPRRRYHSPLRTGQAEQTRHRILESAFALFTAGGYSGTSVKAIAAGAEVSPETVYLVFGGKRGVLHALIEWAIAGPKDAGSDEALWLDVAGLATPAARLERMVAYSCAILARTREIHAVIRGAADSEPFATDLGRRLLRDRLRGQTDRVRRFLANDVKADLSIAEAGQRYCALVGPELYYTVTVGLGWTAEEYRGWVTEVLVRDLLRGP